MMDHWQCHGSRFSISGVMFSWATAPKFHKTNRLFPLIEVDCFCAFSLVRGGSTTTTVEAGSNDNNRRGKTASFFMMWGFSCTLCFCLLYWIHSCCFITDYTRCLSPPLNFIPLSPTSVSNFSGNPSAKDSSSAAARTAAHILHQLYLPFHT